MQSRPAPDVRPSAPARPERSRPKRSLAALHAHALYRPVPPVGCDDDGYPYEDSAVSESASHDLLRQYLANVARVRLASRAGVTVGSGLMLFFEEGNREAALSPDLFVAFGKTPGGVDLSYKMWEEGAAPELALEILSRSTWRKDVTAKRLLYEALGVGEYWIIDPAGLQPVPITGLQRGADGRYRVIAAAPSGGVPSDVLGLEFVMLDGECRLRDPRTGEIMLTYQESEAARRAAEARVAEFEALLASRR